jgi:glycosyltransferase involved in cell wall biosynthesis
MKVCQLCAVDFTLKHFLLPLIDGMQSRSWAVTAVCTDGPYVHALREQGYRIETLTICRSMNPLRAVRSMLALLRLFRRERFDVLHAHTPVAALVGRIAARLAGIPLVIYTAHGFYFHEGMPAWKRSLFVALERLGGRLTDLLFSQSSEDAEDAIREGIIPASKVLAIGNGVDPKRFDPVIVGDGAAVRNELGIPTDAFVIGCIGRQVREKGIVEFLQAAETVAADHTKVWFLLIGERLASDHASSVVAELAAARSSLGARLVTPGLRTDIPECLAAMDLFCLPSWREGMPRTIIEAMMMGKPVLSTDIRGAREEVIAEVTGILVPVRSADSLAKAMVRFIKDSVWTQKLGIAGRNSALSLYHERRVVELQLERIKKEAHSRGLCRDEALV